MAAAGAAVMWLLRPSLPQPLPVHSMLEVGPADELNAGGVSSLFLPTAGGSRTTLMWTPAGQVLICVGRRGGVQQLYARRLDAAQARPPDHTEGAQVPAVSADGHWVAFWAGATIRKVPLGGGPAMDVAPGIEYPPAGLIWDGLGGLVFGRDYGSIWRSPATAQLAALTTVGDGEVPHTLPCLLPGGRVLLYTVGKRRWTWGDEEIVAHTLATGERELPLRNAVDARYQSTGQSLHRVAESFVGEDSRMDAT